MRFLAIIPLLFLCSCGGDPNSELPPVQAFFGSVNMVGAEVAFGKHAFGVGISYRSIPLPTDVPQKEESLDAKIVYPSSK